MSDIPPAPTLPAAGPSATGVVAEYDAWGRRITLKPLPSECLVKNRLHPLIRDRLSRIREVPHTGVAPLLSVERIQGKPKLVWQYVEGQTLEDRLATLTQPAQFLSLVDRILETLSALHGLGIVHGQIHARNIILTADDVPVLTHFSPLLYEDPSADAHDVLKMLADAMESRDWTHTPLAARIRVAQEGEASLARIGDVLHGQDALPLMPAGNATPAAPYRLRILGAALLCTAASVALGMGIIRFVQGQSPTLPQPPVNTPM